MAVNPYAAVTFWWGPLERSIRLEGTVEKCTEEESNARYATRPRRAKLNHWTQQTSQPTESHEDIEKRFAEVEREWANVPDDEIPRPEYWGGYRFSPESFEFWKGRESRLHDRLLFEKDSNEWTIKRLQP